MTYRRELDGLRAIAVLLVIATHSRAAGMEGGQHGVDVFFVLSGFLITQVLASTTLADFWWRRTMRLFPALLALLVVYAAFLKLIQKPWTDIWPALTYTSNFTAMHGYTGPLVHTWSLALEAQFYLVWPFILMFVRRWKPGPVLLTAWAVLSVARAAYNLTGVDNSLVYYSPVFHATGLILGSACAYADQLRPRFGWIGAGLIVAALALRALHLADGSSMQILVEVGTALLILSPCALYRPLGSVPAVWLGQISYGVYLWQCPFIFFLNRAEMRGVMSMLVGGMLSIGFGALSYRSVERLRRLPPPWRVKPATVIS